MPNFVAPADLNVSRISELSTGAFARRLDGSIVLGLDAASCQLIMVFESYGVVIDELRSEEIVVRILDCRLEVDEARLEPSSIMKPGGFVAIEGGEAFFVAPFRWSTHTHAVYRINGEVGELIGGRPRVYALGWRLVRGDAVSPEILHTHGDDR